MYHWIAAVAPRKQALFLSFLTGWFTVCGCKHFPMSVSLLLLTSLPYRDFYHGIHELDLRPDTGCIDRPLSPNHDGQDMGGLHHLPRSESDDCLGRTFRQQDHPQPEQILAVLSPDWVAGCPGHCCGMCTDIPEPRIRFPYLDQQHGLGKQCHRIRRRPRQSAVQSWWA